MIKVELHLGKRLVLCPFHLTSSPTLQLLVVAQVFPRPPQRHSSGGVCDIITGQDNTSVPLTGRPAARGL